MKRTKSVVVILLAVVSAALLWTPASLLQKMSPDALRATFDAQAAVLMLAWGFIHTRYPALVRMPNDLSPWLSAIAYIVAQFVVPPAHAGVFSSVSHFGSLLWVTARAGATSAVTSLLYDKFIKPWLDVVVPKANA